MSKAKKTDDKPDSVPEEEPQQEEQTETEEANAEALAQTADEFGGSKLLAIYGENNASFVHRYGEKILRIEHEGLNEDKVWDIIWKLPDEMQDPISDIMQRMNPDRKGILSSNTQPEFTELRLFQGTGADPNRPETAIPGQFYMSSKENVGKEFIGAVLAIWEGRTMWGARDGENAVRMPVCTSMDRHKGSHYGDCDTCPNRPWKDGKPNECANDVMAFMLAQNLKDIVLVRFQRTSEPAGRQLMKFVKRGKVPWARWFSIKSEERKSSQDKSRRWYVMQVEPVEGETVDSKLHPFCDAMCTLAERDFIYSGIARIYRQAARAMEDFDDEDVPGMTTDSDDEGYGSMEDMPEDM